jgi:hypothetical protein
MDILIVTIVLIGLTAGLLVMYFGLPNTKPKTGVFDTIEGTLKEDWTPTGKIDFRVTDTDSASPQPMTLRVEEARLIENALGQDIVQLRWRLARLDEAKALVACWNGARAAELEQSRMAGPPVLNFARARA